MSTWQNNFKGVAYRPVPQAADEQRTSTPLSIPREEDHERPSQGKAKGLFRLYCGACSACLSSSSSASPSACGTQPA